MNKQTRLSAILRNLRLRFIKGFRFLTLDMWRISHDELSGSKAIGISAIKAFSMSVNSFFQTNLYSKASSLTYSTILSLVPMLAVIVGIAKGFGLQHVVRNGLNKALPGHEEELQRGFEYVENYLNQVQGGLFVGLGLLILLYTVLMLVVDIEDTFNDIWQAPHRRSWGRRIINYLGIFVLIPVLMILSSGVTIFMTTIKNTYLSDLMIIGPLTAQLFKFLPYALSIMLFFGLYKFMPNVRVRFMPALIAGVIAGSAYQIFQALYISGVLWISRYNAIYGSFAAFPLLLLWLQLSWVITLFGAQLSHSIQNVGNFYFEAASDNASRRYQDFVTLIILSRMTKHFADPYLPPYDAARLSSECKIPARMLGRSLTLLRRLGLIVEVRLSSDPEGVYYQPAFDPELLTVGYVLDLIDRHGVEDFKIDRDERFSAEWEAMLRARSACLANTQSEKIRDL